MKSFSVLKFTLILAWLLAACQPSPTQSLGDSLPGGLPAQEAAEMTESSQLPGVTPYPTRPVYQPGELVQYIAQMGDTLPAVAVHFNTTVDEILQENPFIPASATTMPPGMPMQIPIYYAPFWGSPYQIIPDSLYVNGPAQVGFSTEEFVAASSGWLKEYVAYASGQNRSGAAIINLVALNFSLSPRLLLALLEYQAGALSLPQFPGEYVLNKVDAQYRGLYMQLIWAANTLNNGYYDWRTGALRMFELQDGRLERPDPWQNAATVSLQVYFTQIMVGEDYARAIGPGGLAAVYQTWFGDPWQEVVPHILGSLEQPSLSLPFEPGSTWAYTGGPHTAWGQGSPLAALDFAPDLIAGGCTPTDRWTVAAADGVVARSEPATVILDLDQDGDERTGWVIYYFHVRAEGRAGVGSVLKRGAPIGHPSCEGGRATGTHIHIARKYNGEWIPAAGPLAFNLGGWIAENGSEPYQGFLVRNSIRIRACVCSDQGSQVTVEDR